MLHSTKNFLLSKTFLYIQWPQPQPHTMYRYTMIEKKKTSIMTLNVRFKFLVYKMNNNFLSSLTFKNNPSFFSQYHTLTFCPYKIQKLCIYLVDSMPNCTVFKLFLLIFVEVFQTLHLKLRAKGVLFTPPPFLLCC